MYSTKTETKEKDKLRLKDWNVKGNKINSAVLGSFGTLVHVVNHVLVVFKQLGSFLLERRS